MTIPNQRKKRFLITRPAVTGLSAGAVSLASIVEEINQFQAAGARFTDDNTPEAEVIKQLAVGGNPPHTVVAALNEAAVEKLRERHRGNLIIEEDTPLQLLDISIGDAVPLFTPTAPLGDEDVTLRFVVRGEDGIPVGGASVIVVGAMGRERAMTDEQGRASIDLIFDTSETVSRLVVMPSSGYWSFDINAPELSAAEVNEIILTPLGVSDTLEQDDGWGTKAMNLSGPQDPAAVVRLAVIDSGLDDTHPDLPGASGFDFGEDAQGNVDWRKDASGHGTHVSGTCAALNNGFGMRGMAQGVDISAFKVFPDPTHMKLIDAIDRCIEQKVDIINMSLGGPVLRDSLRQRLAAAREAGILLVAAAGNSGGDVMYPAAFEEVMCVAAVGGFETFPKTSRHASHITQDRSPDGKYFAAAFTCRGPEVDVCAPGVAVISTVPNGGYAAMDGTSMAAPHVAGLAARLLQMRPELRDMPRSLSRSQALHDAVIELCSDLGMSRDLQGAGMPRLPDAGDGIGAVSSAETSERRAALGRIGDLIDEAIVVAETLPRKKRAS